MVSADRIEPGEEKPGVSAVHFPGGKAEVLANCTAYGGPFCIYPWYTLGSSGFHYGVDYTDNLRDFGKADQFSQTHRGNFRIVLEKSLRNTDDFLGIALFHLLKLRNYQ